MGITTGKRRANRRNALKSTGLKSLNGKAAWPNKGKSEKQSQISLGMKGLFIWLLAFGRKLLSADYMDWSEPRTKGQGDPQISQITQIGEGQE